MREEQAASQKKPCSIVSEFGRDWAPTAQTSTVAAGAENADIEGHTVVQDGRATNLEHARDDLGDTDLPAHRNAVEVARGWLGEEIRKIQKKRGNERE